jgi:hypothetical protein
VFCDLRAYCNCLCREERLQIPQPRLHEVTSVAHSPAECFRLSRLRVSSDVEELLLEARKVRSDRRRISIGQGARQVLDLSLDLCLSPAMRQGFIAAPIECLRELCFKTLEHVVYGGGMQHFFLQTGQQLRFEGAPRN